MREFVVHFLEQMYEFFLPTLCLVLTLSPLFLFSFFFPHLPVRSMESCGFYVIERTIFQEQNCAIAVHKNLLIWSDTQLGQKFH